MIERIKKEWKEFTVLLKNIPAISMTVFILSVVAMNLLANKALVNESWIALDCGILVSWISFLAMDMIVKRFGPKASIEISLFATFVNICVLALFAITACIPGDWCLNDYAAGTSWWIIGASSAAFIVSGVVNAILNHAVGKAFKKNPDGKVAFVTRTYISTFIGQFIDNLVFALIFTFPASMIGLWGMTPMTVLALIMFALTGAVVELLCEVIFSPIGYRVSRKWAKEGRGQEYLDLVNGVEHKEVEQEKEEISSEEI